MVNSFNTTRETGDDAVRRGHRARPRRRRAATAVAPRDRCGSCAGLATALLVRSIPMLAAVVAHGRR
jgi:hypothetical protein